MGEYERGPGPEANGGEMNENMGSEKKFWS